MVQIVGSDTIPRKGVSMVDTADLGIGNSFCPNHLVHKPGRPSHDFQCFTPPRSRTSLVSAELDSFPQPTAHSAEHLAQLSTEKQHLQKSSNLRDRVGNVCARLYTYIPLKK